MRICIVTWPLRRSKAAILFLSDFLKIMRFCASEVYLITETAHPHEMKKQIEGIQISNNYNIGYQYNGDNLVLEILDDVVYQIRVCRKLFYIRNQIDIVWIYGGAELVLPMFVARILKKRLFVNVLGLESKRLGTAISGNLSSILSTAIDKVEHFSWRLADRIVVESKSIIDFAELQCFSKKVVASGARFIDTEKFKNFKKYEERENLIGFVGRLSREKGITNFVEAISLMENNEESENPLHFIISGDGPLSDAIKEQINHDIQMKNIEITGWISHDDLPSVLNRMRLLVLPSYTEGLPTIVLEAMACGTPVLATPVGGIPDVIQDNITGFILKDNTPGNISISIQNILNISEQERDSIALNATKFVKNEYSYESSISRFKKILY